jgi:hypothetical protein
MVNTRNHVTTNNAGYASTDALDHAADPGQPAWTTPSTTAAEG